MPHIDSFENLTWSFSWWDRRETPEQCAARALKCLKAIRELFPDSEDWLQVNKEKKGPVALTKRALTERFAKGGFFTDLDHKPMEELGYSVSLLNKVESRRYLNACFDFGNWSTSSSNNATLDCYLTTREAKRTFTLKKCLMLTQQLVEAYRPDYGDVRNFALYKLTKNLNSAWIVYLSRDLSRHLPQLPKGVEAQPFKRLGTILVAADRTFPKTPPKNLDVLKELGQIIEPIFESIRP